MATSGSSGRWAEVARRLGAVLTLGLVAVMVLLLLAALAWPAVLIGVLFWSARSPPPCDVLSRMAPVVAPDGALWAAAHEEACGDGLFHTIVYTVVTVGGPGGEGPEVVLRVGETHGPGEAVALSWRAARALTVRLVTSRHLSAGVPRAHPITIEIIVPPAEGDRPSR